ncbi:MAG TPA: hypothetical protein VFB59_01460 [Candidatus Saccharimonadales bacterium]|nr:hypothetical protein [Candidatus Saccharimonadales bacterium]
MTEHLPDTSTDSNLSPTEVAAEAVVSTEQSRLRQIWASFEGNPPSLLDRPDTLNK